MSASSSCCGCLAGLRKRGSRGTLNGAKVSTFQEALRIGRRNEGAWKPSPQALPTPSPAAWASPAPRYPGAGRVDDMELVIQDLDSDAPRRPAAEERRAGAPRQRSKFEVEQLVASPGSLPRPMAPEQREDAIRALAPTATYEMLARVPRALLEAEGQEAQELRRKMVRGATVVFASAGYPGKRFIFERAAALGVKSVIIDHPDSWSRGLVAEGIVAKFLPVDMSQSSEEVYRQSVALIRGLGGDGVTGPADGIATFVELSVPLAARLCEALGLPGFRPAAVDAARDKHRTRAALKAAGLPTPRNALVRCEAELEACGLQVGFPAVLKPVSGAASLGVKKVACMEELQACYREVQAELGSLVVSSGALVKPDASGAGVSAASVVDLTVLLEQYLDGSEVDVDIVMSEGEWRYAAVSDNGPTLEPYFNETWGLCPSLLSKEQQSELKDLSVKSVQVLGFSSGVFHVECKYTSTGPQLIEVNARMGGGPVHLCNSLVWGVDLVEEALFAALGVPARPAVPAKPLTCVGYSMINAKTSGRLQDLSSVTALRSRPGVLAAEPLVGAGDAVTGPDTGIPTWVAMLMVEGPSSKQALAHMQELEAGLALRIE